MFSTTTDWREISKDKTNQCKCFLCCLDYWANRFDWILKLSVCFSSRHFPVPQYMQLICLYFSFSFYCLYFSFNRAAITWMIPLTLLVLPIYDIFTYTSILNLKSIHHLCWLPCKDLIHCLHTETCRRHIPAWWPLRPCACRGRACRCVRRCPANTVSWANLPINEPRFVSTIISTDWSIDRQYNTLYSSTSVNGRISKCVFKMRERERI